MSTSSFIMFGQYNPPDITNSLYFLDTIRFRPFIKSIWLFLMVNVSCAEKKDKGANTNSSMDIVRFDHLCRTYKDYMLVWFLWQNQDEWCREPIVNPRINHSSSFSIRFGMAIGRGFEAPYPVRFHGCYPLAITPYERLR